MGQEEDPVGEVARRLWDLEEVVRHLLGPKEEAAVRPFQDEEGEQRQKPGQS